MLHACVVQAEWPHVVVAFSVNNKLHLYNCLQVVNTRELFLLAFIEEIFLAVMVKTVVLVLLASPRCVGKPQSA